MRRAGKPQGVLNRPIRDNHPVEPFGPKDGKLFRREIGALNAIRTRAVAGAEKNRKFPRTVGIDQVQKNIASQAAKLRAIEMIALRGQIENRGDRHAFTSRERLQRGPVRQPGPMLMQDHLAAMIARRGGIYAARAAREAIDQRCQNQRGRDCGCNADPAARCATARDLLPDP